MSRQAADLPADPDFLADRRPPGVDLRLLLPAMVAWALLAWLLTAPLGVLVGVATASVLAAVLLVWVAHGRAAHRWPAWAQARLTCLVVGLTLACAAGHGAISQAGAVTELAQARAVAAIEGTVLGQPRAIEQGKQGGELVVLEVKVTQVSARGQTWEVQTPVVVFVDGAQAQTWHELSWRSHISARGRLSPAEPGSATLAAFNPTGSVQVESSPGVVLGVAEHARASLRAAVGPLPADARGLIPGLVIGDTSLTPPELTVAMRETGMSHLSAVSGTNVTGGLCCEESTEFFGGAGRAQMVIARLQGKRIAC